MDTDPGCYFIVTCVCIYNQHSAIFSEKYYYRRSGDGGEGCMEVLTLTVISSLSRGGFSSAGGRGWVGVAASVLFFESGKGCGGTLSSLVM